jgi:hypothetical protein
VEPNLLFKKVEQNILVLPFLKVKVEQNILVLPFLKVNVEQKERQRNPLFKPFYLKRNYDFAPLFLKVERWMIYCYLKTI